MTTDFTKNFETETRNGKAYLRPRRHRMVATVVDMSRHFEDTDTSHLRTIVVHGVKFTREER